MRRAVLVIAACGGRTPPTPPPQPPAIAAASDAGRPIDARIADATPDAPPIAVAAPISADAWHELPFDGGGSMYQVAVAGDTVYAIGDAEAERSDDGGTTWHALSGATHCNSLVASSPKPDRLWASCSDRVITSTDRGATWTDVPSAAKGFVLADDGKLLWGVNAELLLERSANRGRTWQVIGRPGGCGGTPVSITIATQRMWMVCDQDKLLVSANRGATWTAAKADNPRAAADPLDAALAWRVIDGGCALQRSHDGGATWTTVAHKPLQNGTCAPEDSFGLPARAGSSAFVARGPEILTSRDGGVRWTETGAPTPDHLDYVAASSKALFARADSAIMMRSPPAPFTPPAPPVEPVKHLGPFEPSAGAWTKVSGLRSEEIVAAGTTLVALGLEQDVEVPWVSTDEGRTWTSLPACGGAKTIAVSRTDPRRIWLSPCFASDGTPLPPIASHDGKTFAPVPAAAGISILAIDERGTIFGLEGAVSKQSRDQGKTWSTLGGPDEDRSAARIVVGPPGLWAIDGTLAFATSRDHGRTWQPGPPWSGALTYQSVISDGRVLYVLGDQSCSIQVSGDAGRTFHALFSHPLVLENGGDTRSMVCQQPFRITTMTLDAASTLWSVVGSTLRAGTRDLEPALGDREPLALAITPHIIAIANLDATVELAKRR